MNNVSVEQICVTGIERIEDEMSKAENESYIEICVERAYKTMRERAKTSGKVLVGATQSINTETGKVGESYYIIFIITLVGTVVDESAVEAQQRMQQLDPRNVIRGRNH